jgi:hypothetical protein
MPPPHHGHGQPHPARVRAWHGHTRDWIVPWAVEPVIAIESLSPDICNLAPEVAATILAVPTSVILAARKKMCRGNTVVGCESGACKPDGTPGGFLLSGPCGSNGEPCAGPSSELYFYNPPSAGLPSAGLPGSELRVRGQQCSGEIVGADPHGVPDSHKYIDVHVYHYVGLDAGGQPLYQQRTERQLVGAVDLGLEALTAAAPGLAQLQLAQTNFAPIAKQIISESTGDANLLKANLFNAAELFGRTYRDLAGPLNAASQAFDGAVAHTFATKTVLGAGLQIAGLVNGAMGLAEASKSGNREAVISSTKAVVGAAVSTLLAAGAVGAPETAGISAAVALGITVFLEFGVFLAGLGDSGGDDGCMANPTIIVGSPPSVGNRVCMIDEVNKNPASEKWRPFPELGGTYIKTGLPITSATVPGKSWYDFWFEVLHMRYRSIFAHSADRDVRRIDIAFPMYVELETQAKQPGPVGDFYKAYFSAWKANRELDLNGLKSSGDEVPLIHVVRAWNLTHEPGAGYQFEGGYIGSLANAKYFDLKDSNDPYLQTPGNKITIATGPLKKVTLATDARPVLKITLPHFAVAKAVALGNLANFVNAYLKKRGIVGGKS